ncbi:MAG: hypothetical protein ACP5GH_00660 [Nitrososphaeria archaeon]
MKDYAIIYDNRLKALAVSLSRLSEAPAFPYTADVTFDRYMVLWSYRNSYASERSRLKRVLDNLSAQGYVEVVTLLPAPYQKDPDLNSFLNEMTIFDNVGRIIFFDLTPVNKLGVTPRPSVNLSAIPILIKYLKENDVRVKAITFNAEMQTQTRIIENMAGRSENNVLIVDNFVDDAEKYIPVLETYKEKGTNVYIFATFFASSPYTLKNLATVITTNAIPWDDAITLDISGAIAEFVDAIK